MKANKACGFWWLKCGGWSKLHFPLQHKKANMALNLGAIYTTLIWFSRITEIAIPFFHVFVQAMCWEWLCSKTFFQSNAFFGSSLPIVIFHSRSGERTEQKSRKSREQAQRGLPGGKREEGKALVPLFCGVEHIRSMGLIAASGSPSLYASANCSKQFAEQHLYPEAEKDNYGLSD